MGNVPLCISFPQLFSFSNQKDAKVGELWEVTRGNGFWSLVWWRNLFVWGRALLVDLMGLLV